MVETRWWAEDAACTGHGETFFDSDDFVEGRMTAGERQQLDTERRLRAKLICSTCRVQEECLRSALLDVEDVYSVRGGYTAAERAALRQGRVLPPYGYTMATTRSVAPPSGRGWELVRRFAEGERLPALLDEYGLARNTALQEIRLGLVTGAWRDEVVAA